MLCRCAEWIEIGMLERRLGISSGVRSFERARTLAVVLGVKIGEDCCFGALGYLMGMVITGVWGIGR